MSVWYGGSSVMGGAWNPRSVGDSARSVTRIVREDNTLQITVRDKKNPQEGDLTMVFADKPLVFRKWVVRDKAGQQTTVALADARFDLALDPKLFTHARELDDLR